MKKGAALFLLLILYGCSSASKELIQLIEKYPAIEKELKVLSDENLHKIKVPSHLPFKPDSITSTVQRDADADPLFAEIQYMKERNAILHITTYFNRVEKMDSKMLSTVKLKDGTNAYMRIDRANTKELIWSDKKQKTTYLITLFVTEKTNNPWTKDDIIQMAESME